MPFVRQASFQSSIHSKTSCVFQWSGAMDPAVGKIFSISVCIPSLFNITLTLQRFTHQSIKFLLSREWTVDHDGQGFCCTLFLDNFIHDVRRARIKRRHVKNYRIDSWPGSKARLAFNLVPRIFLFSENEKTLGSSFLLSKPDPRPGSQPGKTGDIRAIYTRKKKTRLKIRCELEHLYEHVVSQSSVYLNLLLKSIIRR